MRQRRGYRKLGSRDATPPDLPEFRQPQASDPGRPPRSVCNPARLPALMKSTFICETCRTTRRAGQVDDLAVRRRGDPPQDVVDRGEQQSRVPRCPRCRRAMRYFPNGVKLRRWVRR